MKSNVQCLVTIQTVLFFFFCLFILRRSSSSDSLNRLFDVVRSKCSGERFHQTCAMYVLPLNYGNLFVAALKWDQEFSPPEPVHETATYRCDETRACVMQFWPPDDEHMCSKHVEAWNKLILKQKFCASSWLITEINILRCTFSITSKFVDIC